MSRFSALACVGAVNFLSPRAAGTCPRLGTCWQQSVCVATLAFVSFITESMPSEKTGAPTASLRKPKSKAERADSKGRAATRTEEPEGHRLWESRLEARCLGA